VRGRAEDVPEKPRPGPPRRPGGERPGPGWAAYLGDPRTAVLVFLASALLVGGGRRVLRGARARRAVAALEGPSPSIGEIEAVADFGREGLIELFRLLGTATTAGARDAAGRALATLWAKDELIAEEEKALVRRGFAVDWRARRRYPKGLRGPIPIKVDYGVPFLVEGGPGVSPANLEWSHRVMGSERAAMEEFSPWTAGRGSASFAIEPVDFPANGPHRLVLHAKARAVGLTESWEFDLPHMAFSFEFDPILAVDALLTLPDDARAAAFASLVGLDRPEAGGEGPRPLDLGADLVLRDPPGLSVVTPLPCDLAHSVAIEFEGIPGLYPAGSIVLPGQGEASAGGRSTRRSPIGPIRGLSPDAIDRPGEIRLRAVLTADPDLGWADPDVRSIWPGTLTTGWVAGRVIRR